MVQNIKKIFNKQGFIRLKGVLDYKEDLEPVLNDMAFIMDRLVHRFCLLYTSPSPRDRG